MRMEFKNPEILISLFSPEDIVTTSLTGNTLAADTAIKAAAGSNNTVETLSRAFEDLKFNMGE